LPGGEIDGDFALSLGWAGGAIHRYVERDEADLASVAFDGLQVGLEVVEKGRV
jgi:hypothetical protein